MIYIIIWLALCLIVVSYSAMDSATKGTKNRRWHFISFFTAWLIGIVSPIIFLVDGLWGGKKK